VSRFGPPNAALSRRPRSRLGFAIQANPDETEAPAAEKQVREGRVEDVDYLARALRGCSGSAVTVVAAPRSRTVGVARRYRDVGRHCDHRDLEARREVRDARRPSSGRTAIEPRSPRAERPATMNDRQRTEVLLISVEETLDRLRDRDDPMLEEYIARLERIHADLAAHIATLERMHAHLAARLARRGYVVNH